jgi:4-cresol dehydrogenase (hydroxylating)
VADVQEIIRAANRFAVPLWPISRGENLGYGGARSFRDASLILDLSRLNRIIEVNVPDAFCLVEPGVSFLQMFDYLERHDLPLWLSVPGYGAGSIIGNALERGVSSSPYGDHAAQICGLELILGDGELVRTGMGAMPHSGMWQRQQATIGPRYDEIFLQSNYGVVTKMGLWLMRAPEASAAIEIEIAERDSLGAVIECLAALKRLGVIQDSPAIASYLTSAALCSAKSDWMTGKGALDQNAETLLLRTLGLGWWNVKVRLYGLPDMVSLCLRQVEQELARLPGCSFHISRWQKGAPISSAHRGVPSIDGAGNVRWLGENGAHIDFSVAIPVSGAEALKHARWMIRELAACGLDYHSAFYLRDRHILNVVQLIFDQADEEMCQTVDVLYRRLINDVAMRGYGINRSPLDYRADVAATFSFGGNAIGNLAQRLKRALDPGSILSPGKDGLS